MLYPLSRRLLETDIVLPIFASAAVLLRFVARKSRKIPLEGDDWLILVALVRVILVRLLYLAHDLRSWPSEYVPMESMPLVPMSSESRSQI